MESEGTNDVDVESVEFSMEDTYDHLKDLKIERAQEVVQLMNIIKNNEARTLGPNVTPEEIRYKRLKFVQAMEKFVAKEQPKDLPIPTTPHFYHNALKELEDEVFGMEELNKITNEEIAEIEADIAYMEKKKATLEQMKEASLTAAENEVTTNYDAQMLVTKRIFQQVKKDLEVVVDVLFPENEGFQQLLCILTRALSKGGDDLYIDVTPSTFDFVNFLEEADIIQFHPNDNTKIKLVNL